MDRRTNPYAPGAGTPPPELVGRDELIEDAEIALDRLRNGLAAKSLLMVGLRGVGKTVLLNRMLLDATDRGFECVPVEAPEDRSLPGALAGPLNSALIRMSRSAAARELSRRARRALAGFVGAMKLGFEDITLSIDIDKEEGVADSGDLDTDLTSLLQVAGEAAKARGTALVLFIDEMQYVEERQLGALIAALHRTAQRQLPVTLIGSGLPQLVGHAGSAKSYAERMFSFPEVGPLSDEAAARAVEAPAKRLGVSYSPAALDENSADYGMLPVFPAGVGRRLLACRPGPGCNALGCGGGDSHRRGRVGCYLLPGAVRAHDAVRTAIPARDGGPGTGTTPFGRDRAGAGKGGSARGPDACEVGEEGDDPQPRARGTRRSRRHCSTSI